MRSRTIGLALALSAVASCILLIQAPAQAGVPEGDRFCPLRGEDPIATSRLVGHRVAVARRMAARHDCVVRVVKRNGEWLAVTDDYSTSRVNVVVRNRRVTRIHGVY